MAESSISICSLGMFILDEIEFTGSGACHESIMGGAGTYAAIGARLVSGAEQSHRVGWIVDAGSDFPIEFRQVIESWRTSCLFREDKSRLTTRAWNGYGQSDHRSFKYLTPKMQLDHNSLSNQLLHAQVFHLVCSAERCLALVHGILSRRNGDKDSRSTRASRPVFIWEPIPDRCLPEHMDSFKQAIQQVDLVSPNSEELAGFFLEGPKSQDCMAADVLEWGIGPNGNGLLVVREGEKGCSAWSKQHKIHLRAYHTPVGEAQSRVVDPTGGGNAFLGALGMAFAGKVCPPLVEAKRMLDQDNEWMKEPVFDLIVPLVYATVAASFVIEQTGMPTYRGQSDGAESWNGQCFEHRLRVYLNRERAYLTTQRGQWIHQDR